MLERRRHETSVSSGRRPSPERRDSDYTLDPLTLERGACRPSEVQVRAVHGLGARIRWHDPEHRVRARECLVHDGGIAMRAPHNIDSFADMRREARRVARDHANRFLTTKDTLKNLVSDSAGWSSNDDHDS
jgi:hypothetical protein